jgi:hypothetical protein
MAQFIPFDQQQRSSWMGQQPQQPQQPKAIDPAGGFRPPQPQQPPGHRRRMRSRLPCRLGLLLACHGRAAAGRIA